MSRTITQRELRNDPAAFLREVQAGQTILVTLNGMPVAELRPLPPRRFVPRAAIAEAAKRAPHIDAGRFRADLYFRLKVFQIRIPDLKERPGDIPALISAAIDSWNERMADPARRVAGISAETLSLLQSYDWPGNVRELMGVVEHACILCEGSRILPSHLPPEILENETDAPPAPEEKAEGSRRYQAPDPASERDAIVQALEEAEGNRTRAAAALGMGRTTLWQKLKAYGLEHI